MQRTKRRRSLTYFAFILPAMLFFVSFFIFPFLKSLWLSFTDAYGYNPDVHLIGLKNYQEALSNPNFKNALWITLKYTLFVTVLANLSALGLAFLLDGNVHFKKLFRAIFFLPT